MQHFIVFFLFPSILSCHSLFANPQIDTLYNQPYEWVSGQRDSLPDWIFSQCDKNEIIAVSDPLLKPAIAREQAIQRALFIYSLRDNTQARILSDYYSSTAEQYNEETFAYKVLTIAILEQLEKKYFYKVINEHTSIFGESYIAIKVLDEQENTPYSSFNYIGEFMQVYTQEREESLEVKTHLLMNFPHSNQISQSIFSAKGKPTDLKINSVINDKKLYTSIYPFYYKSTTIEDVYNLKESAGVPLNFSFWNAYTISLLNAILSSNHDNITIKNMKQSYGNFNTHDQELYREKIDAKLSITPYIKGIIDNKLYVEWQINPHNK